MIRQILAVMLLTSCTIPAIHAEDGPQMPVPQKEHEWLKQFVGEWEVESEAVFGPDMPPVKCKGTESTRQLGGFWIVADLTSDVPGQPMSGGMMGQMMVGYDSKLKKYIGTWACSMDSTLWKYEGSVDAKGTTLTLEADGPDFMDPGKIRKYRDITEFKDADHRILSSEMLGDDGKWIRFMTAHYHRKK